MRKGSPGNIRKTKLYRIFARSLCQKNEEVAEKLSRHTVYFRGIGKALKEFVRIPGLRTAALKALLRLKYWG